MTITEEQRRKRNRGLGASDAPILLGLSPYKTPADLALEKRSKVTMQAEAYSQAAELGNLFEEPIAKVAEERIGVKLYKPCTTFSLKNSVLFCHPDRMVGSNKRGAPLVEIKFSCMNDRWGHEDEGACGVPSAVYAQVVHQMVVTSAPYAYVAAMLTGGFGTPEVRIFKVDRDDDECERLVEAETHWWNDYVVDGKRMPSDMSALSAGVYKRVNRKGGKRVAIDGEIVWSWQEAAKTAREAKKRADEAKGRVLAAIGDAEIGICDSGVVTYFESERKGYEVKPTKTRTLRYKVDPEIAKIEKNLLTAWSAGGLV